MSLKITGLDKLQRQLKDAESAMRSLDGTIASLRFDPTEPASVQAAVANMENAIDEKIAPYGRNAIVQTVAAQMKASYRAQILERAALARTAQGTKPMTAEELPSVLRQMEDTVTDLRWADRPSFVRHIRKLSRLLHSAELDEITRNLSHGINLEAWIEAGKATQSGMVGSATLEWLEDQREELGLVVLLIDRFVDDSGAALSLASDFYYTGSKYTWNLQNMMHR